ncbi:2-oxoacid:ferredoxin oxidoreductase subunit gamma [bacterium]|nr:MAG: 2-oxoacid:ferredoxin oxidoreductase subunit gamma [bacterium]
MKDSFCHLIIAGSGGQGVLYAGKLLAQSAMLEGKQVTWFPSYGAEIRGGTANCTVIISEEMIGSPSVLNPESLMLMNSASMDKFLPKLKSGGIAILNTSLIKNHPQRSDIAMVEIKATDIAEKLGSSQVTNAVMLGALIGKTGIVQADSICKAIEETAPEHRKKTIPLNIRAFKKGMEVIEN